jgi:hypothetical protein
MLGARRHSSETKRVSMTGSISFSLRVAVPQDVLLQELEGETVFLNLDGGRYFGLDEVGTRIWKALTTAESIASAYDVLLAEYDVDPQVLRRDVEDLVEKLVNHGLLMVVHESNKQ